MKILAIETSCDETAVSIVDATGGLKKPTFKILSSVTLSQANIHAQYGGVFPAIAKREHSKSLIPILKEALTKARLLKKKKTHVLNSKFKILNSLLEREPELREQFFEFIPTIKKPDIDAIAVTYGPGLEPALWVGINFAKALSLAWNVPIIPVNHMEGHSVAALLVQKLTPTPRGRGSDRSVGEHQKDYTLAPIKFPILALLISGGHTELVLTNNLLSYKVIGETHDDAVGEAFDKVARMLGLPYPGGPEISKIAEIWEKYPEQTRKNAEKILRESASGQHESAFRLPRPMLHSGDFNFSFSGLKTAVLYTIKKIPKLTDEIKASIAKEFEEAVTEVLVKKTLRAAEEFGAKTIIIGGGVAANKRIRKRFEESINPPTFPSSIKPRGKNLKQPFVLVAEPPDTVEGGGIKKLSPRMSLYISNKELSTDNAVMIALAGYLRAIGSKKRARGATSYPNPRTIKAVGNLRLS